MSEVFIDSQKNNRYVHTYFGIALALHAAIAFLLLFSLLPDNPWPVQKENSDQKPLILKLKPDYATPTALPQPSPISIQKDDQPMQQSLFERGAAIKPRLGPGLAQSVVKQTSLNDNPGEELAEPEGAQAAQSDSQAIAESPIAATENLDTYQPLDSLDKPSAQDKGSADLSEPTPLSEVSEAEPIQSTIHNQPTNTAPTHLDPPSHHHITVPPAYQRQRIPKKQLSLADIAQTFLSGTRAPEECRGNDATNFWREGDSNLQPTQEEWIKLNYLNKFISHFNMTARCNASFNALIKTFDGTIAIPFSVLLDRNGFLIKAEVESNFNPQVNAILTEVLQQANPYPRLPNHYTSETIGFGIIVHIEGIQSFIVREKQLVRRKQLLDKSRNPFYK